MTFLRPTTRTRRHFFPTSTSSPSLSSSRTPTNDYLANLQDRVIAWHYTLPPMFRPLSRFPGILLGLAAVVMFFLAIIGGIDYERSGGGSALRSLAWVVGPRGSFEGMWAQCGVAGVVGTVESDASAGAGEGEERVGDGFSSESGTPPVVATDDGSHEEPTTNAENNDQPNQDTTPESTGDETTPESDTPSGEEPNEEQPQEEGDASTTETVPTETTPESIPETTSLSEGETTLNASDENAESTEEEQPAESTPEIPPETNGTEDVPNASPTETVTEGGVEGSEDQVPDADEVPDLPADSPTDPPSSSSEDAASPEEPTSATVESTENTTDPDANPQPTNDTEPTPTTDEVEAGGEEGDGVSIQIIGDEPKTEIEGSQEGEGQELPEEQEQGATQPEEGSEKDEEGTETTPTESSTSATPTPAPSTTNTTSDEVSSESALSPSSTPAPSSSSPFTTGQITDVDDLDFNSDLKMSVKMRRTKEKRSVMYKEGVCRDVFDVMDAATSQERVWDSTFLTSFPRITTLILHLVTFAFALASLIFSTCYTHYTLSHIFSLISTAFGLFALIAGSWTFGAAISVRRNEIADAVAAGTLRVAAAAGGGE
ncbi:hypothetical protein HK102_001270, partial [Quaeritorhiza haematococci]